MNQILYEQEKRKKESKPLEMKKILLIFVILITLFGLILLGQGIYNLYKNKVNKKTINPAEEGEDATSVEIPVITITKTEDNKALINVQSEIQVSHILYSWNNEEAKTIDETGKTSIEEIIDIPTGENILNISVIDENGKETTKQETFTLEASNEPSNNIPIVQQSKPEINLSVIGNDIKISITSQEDLSSVTYKWNSEEEKSEDINTYENKKNFEKLLEIPKGQNTLKIVAKDKNGNTTEESREIKGITKPKTKVVAKGEYLDFTVTAEENIKQVEFTFNGKKALMTTQTFGQTTVVHYKVKMVEGKNYLKIVSTTENDATDTSVWVYEYKKSTTLQ